MTKFAIALGANIGDRIGALRDAVASMRHMGTISSVGALYETEPIGGPEQPPYLNSVVVLDSPDGPEQVLAKLQEIESDAGRKRSVPWGPRTLDLDIVATDGEAVSSENLQIPHPRASVRRFVLEPLADVWPDADVGQGLSASEALERVKDQKVELFARRWADPET